MFKTIMVPVDLAHRDQLTKSLKLAAEVASHDNATITLVGVSADTPGGVARTPSDYKEKLKEFAAEASKAYGGDFSAKAVFVPDPRIDLDEALRDTAHELGADLAIMASHVPTFADHVIASNAGAFASHADLSVLIVR